MHQIVVEDAVLSAEVENLQFCQRFEHRKAHAGDGAVGQPQALQVGQRLQMHEPRVADVGLAEIELLKVDQPGKVSYAIVGDPSVLERKVPEILQVLKIGQRRIVGFRPKLQGMQRVQVGQSRNLRNVDRRRLGMELGGR